VDLRVGDLAVRAGGVRAREAMRVDAPHRTAAAFDLTPGRDGRTHRDGARPGRCPLAADRAGIGRTWFEEPLNLSGDCGTSQQELWAFGQYCLRHGLADEAQRGYVWLPFDALADTDRLQALGAQLIAATSRPGWKIEARAIHAVTRLPLAHDTHTGRFGELVIGGQPITIDQDPAGALAELHDAYRENLSADLPELSPPPQQVRRLAATQRNGLARISVGSSSGQAPALAVVAYIAILPEPRTTQRVPNREPQGADHSTGSRMI
jgi:hypothetical protein